MIQSSEEERVKIQLKQNNEELDRICNKICLCIGWSGVLFLIIYVVYIIVKTHN
jgi:hypothetical protein